MILWILVNSLPSSIESLEYFAAQGKTFGSTSGVVVTGKGAFASQSVCRCWESGGCDCLQLSLLSASGIRRGFTRALFVCLDVRWDDLEVPRPHLRPIKPGSQGGVQASVTFDVPQGIPKSTPAFCFSACLPACVTPAPLCLPCLLILPRHTSWHFPAPALSHILLGASTSPLETLIMVVRLLGWPKFPSTFSVPAYWKALTNFLANCIHYHVIFICLIYFFSMFLLMYYFLFFWLCHMACRILVPQPGIESTPSAIETLES